MWGEEGEGGNGHRIVQLHYNIDEQANAFLCTSTSGVHLGGGEGGRGHSPPPLEIHVVSMAG